MKLFLYNTESRKKEEFRPEKKGEVRIYTCGPTVYDYAHIGNLRTYVFEDCLRRTLRYFGMKVIQAMNITDVEDKIIKRAREKGEKLDTFVEPYIKAFFDDLKALSIEPVEFYPRATHYISFMIEMIEKLIKTGDAYLGGDGSVYFAIKKFPKYGRLSHLPLSDLQGGTRVASDEYDKEHIADFVLWKKYDPERDGEIFWESPFGKGRPGWHIECSAMAVKLLGDQIDIHAGGVDNIFPHHENEIAQSECFTQKLFARLWVHGEHLLVEGHKMAKSLKNFFTLRDLMEKGYSGREVRMLFFQAHYRAQLNFTLPALDGARQALTRLDNFVQRLQEAQGKKEFPGYADFLKEREENFSKALADDLHLPLAVSQLFDLVHEGNLVIDRGEMNAHARSSTLALLQRMDTVLGLIFTHAPEGSIPEEVHELLMQREEARKSKNFARADQLRLEIRTKGYVIEDAASGAKLRKAPK